MKYLVIPDVHQKLDKVRRIVENNKFDKLISLGDWFDNFYDSPEDSMRTAMYILDLYEELGDNFIWLMGNHDIPYLFPETFDETRCSGTTRAKLKAIQEVFADRLDRKRIRLHYEIKLGARKYPLFLSHAGVSKYHFAHKLTGTVMPGYIRSKCNKVMDMLFEMEDNPMIGGEELSILMAGRARMGSLPTGGIIWQDWNLEFEPLPRVSQIVGHTPTHNPQVIDHAGQAIAPDEGTLETGLSYHIKIGFNYNFNIDTHLNNYVIVENGKTPKITLFRNE